MASSAWTLGFCSADRIWPRFTAAVCASMPTWVMADIAAATWSKLTPSAAAFGTTMPIEPAKSDASAAPSWMAAVSTSPALAAVMFSWP